MPVMPLHCHIQSVTSDAHPILIAHNPCTAAAHNDLVLGWLHSCQFKSCTRGQITYALCSDTQAEARFGKRIVVDDTAAAGPPSVVVAAALPPAAASSSACTVFAAVVAAVVEQVWLAGSAFLGGR